MNKLMMAFLLVALCAFSIAPAVSQTQLINSFESSSDLSNITAWGSAYSQTTTDATQGSYALQVNYMPGASACVVLNATSPWNLSAYNGLAVDVSNPTNVPVSVNIKLNDTSSTSSTDVTSNTFTIQPNETVSVVVPLSSTYSQQQGLQGMETDPLWFPGLLNALSWNGPSDFNPGNIYSIWLSVSNLSTMQTVIFDNIRAVTATTPSNLYSGFVDGYGQYAFASWPEKIDSTADLTNAEAAEQADLAANPATPASWDSYGGWASGPQEGTRSYFGVKSVNGRWWLIDPLGHLFFSSGLDTVSDSCLTNVSGRTQMFTSLPSPTPSTMNFYTSNLQTRYGGNYQSVWQSKTVQRMKSWGFNTIGAFADTSFTTGAKLPYVQKLSDSGTYSTVTVPGQLWGPMPDPFDPAYASAMASNFKFDVTGKLTDPMLLGYFVDNELPWTGSNGNYSLPIATLALNSSSSPAKSAFVSHLTTEYGSIGALNSAWGTSFSSWSSLNAPYTVPSVPTSAQTADLSALLSLYATQYFNVVSGQVKAADANHLYIGCKFANVPPAEVLTAAGAYCGIVTFDLYRQSIDSVTSAALVSTGRPCLVAECSVGSTDGTGMFTGNPYSVNTSQDRVTGYTSYVDSVVACPSLVGYNWFQYTDEPVAGRSFDGENENLGFVTVTDTVYQPLVSAARDENSDIYQLWSNTPTSMSVASLNGAPGQTVTFSATLHNSSGSPLAGESLSVLVDGIAVGSAVTNSSGVATENYFIPDADALVAHAVSFEFGGDGSNNPSNGSGVLTVAMVPATLAANAVSGIPGQTITLGATLNISSSGSGLSGMPILFNVDGALVGSAVTDAGGTASLAYTIPSSTYKPSHTVSVSFAGTATYIAASGSSTLNVSQIPTEIYIGNVTGTTGQSVTLTTKLVANNYLSLSGITVSFLLNGSTIGTGVTNSSGSASYTFSIPSNLIGGWYTTATSFSGNSGYLSASSNASLEVITTPTTLTVSPVAGELGQPVSLVATLTMSSGGSPVSGRSLSFSVDGATIGSAITNSNGVATEPFTIPSSDHTGNHTVDVAFATDNAYTASSGWSTLTASDSNSSLSASSASGAPGQIITLSAHLTSVINGAALVGKTVAFKVDGGSVGSATTDSGGNAYLGYLIPANSYTPTHTIYASFGGDADDTSSSASATLTISAIPTETYISNSSGTAGNTVTLSANTVANYYAHAAGVTLTFSVNGATVGTAVTNSSGVATFNYTVPSTDLGGWLTIGASFGGNATYSSSSASAGLDISPVPTQIYITPTTGVLGQSVVFTATATSTNTGAPLSGQWLSFSLDGSVLWSAETNSAGVATISYGLPSSDSSGSHTISATFSGNVNYAQSTGTGILTADSQTSLIVEPATGAVGNTISLSAALKEASDAVPISGKSLTFGVNGATVGNADTDGSGVASLPIVVQAGTGNWGQAISASFAGDGLFAASSGAASLTVTDIASEIVVSSLSGTPGQTVTIKATVKSDKGTFALANRGLSYTVNGFWAGSATSNVDGIAMLSYTIPSSDKAGSYVVKVSYTGDSHYSASAGTTTLTVT